MDETGSETPKRSFWTWLTIVYFVLGIAALVFMATKDSQLAANVGVYWAVIFVGLGLVSLGSDNLHKTWGQVVRAVGWVWLALILAMISLTNNQVITG